MLKLLLIAALSFAFLEAKNSVGTCIPIGKVLILKKSIMTLKLSKKQKEKLYLYEKKLKDNLTSIKEGTKRKDEVLSALFDKEKFLTKKFLQITKRENKAVSAAIAEYFTKMYQTLTKEQKRKLIKRFKRIEKKRRKSHSK